MKRICALAAMIAVLPFGTAAGQEQPSGSLASRSGYFSIGLTGGMMVDPDMAAGMVSLDYYVTDDVSVGPYFHIGGSGRNKYWGVSGQVKFSASLAGNSSVRPFGHLGIGFVELDFEEREHDPEMTYLFPVGGGMEFELNDMVSLEFEGMFNITEDTFAGLMVGARILL